MLRRFAKLEISLAAKCQILFGAAVIIIIAAALAVPWGRMEQLTRQPNDRAAAYLADDAMLRHVLGQTPPPLALSLATTRPGMIDPSWDRFPHMPRILPLDADRRLPLASTKPGHADDPANAPPPLTVFERRALASFREQGDGRPISQPYTLKDGTQEFRYAQAIYLKSECLQCHTTDASSAGASAQTQPATLPASIDLAPLPASRHAPPLATPIEDSKLVGMVSVDFPSGVDESQLLLNRVFILIAGLLAGTFAIIAFYVITNYLILQPVRVLQETAEKVSQGDLNIRSDISTGDEFQQLSETFNAMLANLKQSSDQLRAINNTLDVKLSQLAESNVALYESNRLKSEFLANVSHELRTPLNSILGFADLLNDAVAPADDSKPARYIQNILTSGRNLLDLINDLLDLAKIEAGRMEVRSEPLSLPDLFEGLSGILKPLVEQKQLTIVATVAPGVPILHTDPGKLQQVLYNFLANAIKFSPPGERIVLHAQREGEAGEFVHISVTDRGPGVAPDKQQIIFEKFRQADASVTRTHSGTGLGLAISKELTALMGGRIGVLSQPGEGAVFWIVLPLKIQAAAMDVRGRMALSV
jgi:two-component system, NarL family, sensor histidine kinase BarA